MKTMKPNVPKIIICKISNPSKKNIALKQILKHFEIERNHKLQYDYDNKCFLPK
jgi:hypothetical protein